jgi:arylsulfatase A-like enzyme
MLGALLPLAGLLAAGLLGGCSRPLPPGVLLVTVDTWRADHFTQVLAPNAWALAEEGQRYTNAWTPIGLTTAAHASLLTGLLPPDHGLRGNNHHGYRLDERFTTVAEVFSAAGFDTAAFVSAWPAGPEGGMDQGFDTFDGPDQGERPTQVAVEGALEWLDERQGPWFLWVHAYDPHGPYLPPEEFLEALGGGRADQTRYAAEVMAADAALAPLYKRARKGGAGIVITSDHGEVHQEETCGWQHERSSAEVVLRVPLAVIGEGFKPGTSDARVGLTDLFPTLLKLGGVVDRGGHTGQALPRPGRLVWIAESGMCDPHCAPGCEPFGFEGKDRVVYGPDAVWLDRPGTRPHGDDPSLAMWLDNYARAALPDQRPEIEQGRALGYTK